MPKPHDKTRETRRGPRVLWHFPTTRHARHVIYMKTIKGLTTISIGSVSCVSCRGQTPQDTGTFACLACLVVSFRYFLVSALGVCCCGHRQELERSLISILSPQTSPSLPDPPTLQALWRVGALGHSMSFFETELSWKL